MASVKLDFVGTDFVASLDSDGDNQPSVKLAVKLGELLTEFSGGKGEMKAVKFEFQGSKLVLQGDLNQDGDASLVLEIDLAEGFDEVVKKVKP